MKRPHSSRNERATFSQWAGIACMLLILLRGWGTPARAAEFKRNAPSAWERSIVTLAVAAKKYDHYQPWSRPTRQVDKLGVVLSDHQVLSTADGMFDRTLVRLQKGGRGRWWIGEVTWIDYHANLALVTTSDPEFWSDLKPVALSRTTPQDGRLQIVRWREGN